MKTNRLVLLLAAFLALLASVRAQGPDNPVQPVLVADTTTIAAGKPFTVGVHFPMPEGWHLYWRNYGEVGSPPKIEWQLPPGFTVGEIQWPLPEALLTFENSFLNYIYHDEALLFVEITPPANASGEAVIAAAVEWQACKTTCVPGEAKLSLKLPVGTPAAANADLFAKWRARLPETSAPPFVATWQRASEQFSVKLTGVPAGTTVELFPIRPNGDVTPGRPSVAPAAADGSVSVSVKAEGATAQTPWSALVVLTQGATRKGWMIADGAPAPASQAAAKPSAATAAAPPKSFWAQLGAAFLGGLILNLMPCVLPVIGLKIFGFVSQAGENKRRVFHLGLAFIAGVFVFFLGLAVAVVALRSAGDGLAWGFQFQDAYVLTGLTALVLAFALSLLGVFEITLAGGATNQLGALGQREGLGGAFFQGMFTTLLGTSCTAPFMGPVLGYAVTQPTPVVVAVFLTMAAGLSLPYFLLTWQPGWMRFLPKPGAWMERFKQAMGFVMLGVAVWLVTVLATHSAEVAHGALWFLFAVALACWLYGLWHRLAALIGVAVLICGAWFGLVHGKYEGGATPVGASVTHAGVVWEPFNDESLAAALAADKPVFVDFTAEWCLNCKVNEKRVVYTEELAKVLKSKGVVTLRADYTKKDPAIKKWLTKFERVGVPVYVLYRPGEPEPHIFPELLTMEMVVGELEKIR